MKYSKKEIELCRKIAEKGVRFEPPDDWHGAYHVYRQNKTFPWADGEDKPYYKSDEFVWLPEVSDCLEWLQEKAGVIEVWKTGQRLFWFCRLKNHKWWSGKTPLLACLKAVLAVLEEG